MPQGAPFSLRQMALQRLRCRAIAVGGHGRAMGGRRRRRWRWKKYGAVARAVVSTKGVDETACTPCGVAQNLLASNSAA